MAMAMMAALFVACGDDGTDDETPPPAVPTIALDGGDIDQPQEITNPMSVKIGVTAPGAIAGFTVTIDSPALTAEMLATVGLATELNLVNPGSMAEALGALGFPSGEAVSGKTALTFDISKLVPMIAQIYNETSDHKFILKVTDAKGKSTTKTLTCHLTGKVALAYNNDADLWANTATVTAANVPDGGSVQYRVKGAADWTDAVLVEGSKYRLAPVYETSKNAAGLDVHTIKAGTGVFAATTYEVRIAKDGQAVDSKEFATAVGDKIPNGDMSGWSKRIWIDGSNNEFPITYPNPEGMKVWDDMAALCESKENVEAPITEENKGGLVANYKGIRVFIPASQSGIAKGGDMAGMVGKTVQMKITEVNRARRRVIGSIRAVSSEARKAAQEKIWSEIEVGKKYHGVVKSLTSYGAFVDIGGVDGMVHVSELSWNRIKTPADVVKVGDEIDVYVISFDPEKHKISLGYKTAEMNPWNQFMTNYAVGDVVDAKIVKLMTFGAFAEILPGVDGLIHISQIADRRIGKPEDVLSEGQDVKVKITDVDAENKRISLSIRALLEDNGEDAE